MIIFKDISKTFAKETEREVSALDNISFEIKEHEFVSIVGPSGCGKTTLLRIVAGLIQPDAGNVIHQGDTQPSTALVFQAQGLMPWLTVMENIGLGLELKKIPHAIRKPQILDFMKRVKLDGFQDYYPHELSGGMRQRVALARAFLTNPDILLMDEPFGSLDAQTRVLLQEELLKLWRVERNTVLFVTHDIDEAILLGDRVIVLSDRPGKVYANIEITTQRPRNSASREIPELKEIRLKIWNILEKEVRQDLQLD